MIMFRDTIISEYKNIKSAVRVRAFRYNLNNCDLLSKVNEKLAVNVNNRNFEMEHISQFWLYVNRMINCCALDLVAPKIKTVELVAHDVDSGIQLGHAVECNRIISAVLCRIKKPVDRDVFTYVVIDGAKYDEAAAKFDMPINSVKTIIFNVRKMAQNKYNHLYLDAIS